jgi:hypothetical protein
MKICFLETSKKGPTKNHLELFNHKKCDFYYVTFGKEIKNDSKCLAFCPNTKWGETRNKLYELVPKIYDYYAFIDDDIIFSSNTNLGFIDQLITDLNNTNPIVLSAYYLNNNNENTILKPMCYFNNFFGNNCFKIYNKDFLNYFFPCITKFGGTYDTCHMNNILEIKFMNKIICSHNILMKNPVHSGNYTIKDKENMKKLWVWVRPFLIEKIDSKDPLFIKKKYLEKNCKIIDFDMEDNKKYLTKPDNIFKSNFFKNMYN